MSWDIDFLVRFGVRESPSVRFARVSDALARRPTVGPMATFQLIEHDYTRPPAVELDGDLHGYEAPEPGRVADIVAQHAGDEHVAFKAAWRTSAPPDRGGPVVTGAVTIVVPGTAFHWSRPALPRVDLVWSVGDWRRYSPYVGDSDGQKAIARARARAVIMDLVTVVDVGAESIWGLDDHRVVTPEHLFAVYHRRVGDYRVDVAAAADAHVPADLEAALRDVPDIVTVETGAGPIVYHEEFGNGDLCLAYAALTLI